MTTVQQGNTIRIYAVVFGVLISIIHLRNHLGGDPRPKFVQVMQGFNSDLKTANISKHMYRLVSSTVQWHDVEVQIYNLVLMERRLERAVQGETADQAAARRRQARETRRVRIDFVKRCIGRAQEILGEGMQAIDNENTTNASLNKSAAQKQFLLAEMTGIINRLKTLPASAEGDVTEMRPREKYFLLPEEAQNAIWDEKWPASKVMFYWLVRGVMDIFATTSTEPMATYSRHDFRLTCKNIWNRVVAIDIQNHYRKQHSDAQIVAMKPLAVNNVSTAATFAVQDLSD